MKLNIHELAAIGIFVIFGMFMFFVFEQDMFSNFIDNALSIPIGERHD